MAPVRTNFNAQLHGFQFRNRFEIPFEHPLELTLPFVGPIDLEKIVYGLCGGMCFAALDYFHENRPVPSLGREENIGLELLRYLQKRQLDSLSLPVVIRLMEWMLLEDHVVGRLTTRWEIPKLRRRLDKGLPVVLALIRVEGIDDPTKNHQVLALGYDLDQTTKRLTISIYDPNHPKSEPTLTMSLARPSHGIEARQSTGEPLRGVFLIGYTRQGPP